VVNVTGGVDFVLNLADGFSLMAADVGATIMVMAPGPSYAVLWTTIDTFLTDNSATLHDAVTTDFYSGQAVIYREVAQTASGTRPTLLAESWKFRSSLTTRASADFDVWSIDGSFVPATGQPVLVTHNVLGDIFGGLIQQTKATLIPGRSAILTECQCVSWDLLLTRRLLRLAQSIPGTFTDSFLGTGSAKTFTLSQTPLSITSATVYTSYAMSGASWAGGTVTMTFGGSLPSAGQHVLISGVQITPGSGVGYNGGPFLVLTSGGGSITYAMASNPGARTGGGAVAIVETASVQTVAPPGTLSGYDWYYTQTSTDFTQDAGLTALSGTQMLYVVYTFLEQLNYYSQSAGSIATALAAILAPDGVTATVVTGPAVTSLAFSNQDTVDSALATLCQYVSDGTTNYWYYMDARRGLHFDVVGVTVSAPWNVSVPSDVLVQISNTTTLEKLANGVLVDVSVSITGANVYQGILGDGAKRTFNTTYPIGSLLSLTRGSSSPQTFGIVGDPVSGTGKQWYWSAGSSAIIEDAGQSTLSSAEFLGIVYLAQTSALETYQNTAAQAVQAAIEGGSGEYDTYYNPSGAPPVLGGSTSLAQLIAEYYADPAQSVDIISYRGGLASGQGITVDVPNIAGPGSFVVDSVQMTAKGNLLMWTCTLISGAAIGDWRTALKGMSGAGGASLTALGGVSNGGGGSTFQLETL
jgi:hypothetical protein